MHTQNITIENKVCFGSFGIVYRISEDRIVKLFKKELTTYDENILEFEIQGDSYNAGISAPRPHRIIEGSECKNLIANIKNPYKNMLKPVAIEMEFIDGDLRKTWGKKHRKRYNELSEKVEEEARKAMTQGFLPGFDYNFSENSIYIPKEDRVVLIDFGLWKRIEKR